MSLAQHETPSPLQIATALLDDPLRTAPLLPKQWNAQVVLTPFGGLPASHLGPSDQLVIGNISYDATPAATLLMRANLYLLESRTYYDFLFVTAAGITKWYWLVSSPDLPNSFPQFCYGPFPSTAKVPSPNELRGAGFAYVGDWKIVGRVCANFVTSTLNNTSTWYSFDAETEGLSRIMNTSPNNELGAALFGAFYVTNVCTFAKDLPLDLQELSRWCRANSTEIASPSLLAIAADYLQAFSNPPTATQQICRVEDIQSIIPGITVPSEGAISPPAWTEQVKIVCYMMGLDSYPYYSRVWYDWKVGCQLTVMVQKGAGGKYDTRVDQLLLKGKTGPSVQYAWDGSMWIPRCRDPQGGFEPMPTPDFIRVANGKCRAIMKDHPAFPGDTISIWSVRLEDGGQWSDFWCWFDSKSRGILFSLAPAPSLTMIDYQMFEQNSAIVASTFQEPVELPSCPPNPNSLRASVFGRFPR